MGVRAGHAPVGRHAAGLMAVLLGVVGLALVGCGGPTRADQGTPTAGPAPQQTAPSTPTPTPVPMRLLTVDPVKGYAGDRFNVSGRGFTPGQTLDVQWATWDGSFATRAEKGTVEFLERQFTPRRVSLGSVTADAQGSVAVSLTAPEDFGEVHDIYLVSDGQDVARGGYRVLRRATVSPAEGPVGTPVTVTVTGMGWKPFENTMALRYDNAYTGFVSAVTTHGSARFQFRAAGSTGPHTVQLTAASAAVPFLNYEQSNMSYIPNMDMQFAFIVTGDPGPAPNAVEWPDPARVTTPSAGADRKPAAQPGVTASLSRDAGPVGTELTVKASGLAPNAPADLLWAPEGAELQNFGAIAGAPILTATTAADGSLQASFTVENDSGGRLVVRVVQNEKLAAELPFYVERSLVSVTPSRVKAGERFTVQIKGGGWTELDKGAAVTYDNAYVGYACSVSSGGDITISLVATGGPGTHLIDLYPMVYRQKGAHPEEYWDFSVPQLTALEDQPGLALGYRVPVIRAAVAVE